MPRIRLRASSASSISNLPYATAATTFGQVAATSKSGTAVTSGTTSIKGSWVQFVASTTNETAWVGIDVLEITGSSNFDLLIDVGVGAAASEVVVVPNVLIGGRTLPGEGVLWFPVRIPSGSRVSVRSQCHQATNPVVALHLLDGTGVALTATNYGSDTSDTSGVSVDPGGTINTKGAWVELTPSCSAAKWVAPMFGNQRNGARVAANWLIDIGVGGAGSETVLIPDLGVRCSLNDTLHPPHRAFPLTITAGQRLSARCQCDVNTAGVRLIDVALVGVG